MSGSLSPFFALIDHFIKDNFTIVNIEYKHEHLDFNRLDYISNHYDLKINCAIKEFEKYSEYEELRFEIQVRTLNQHAWSNTSNSLSYKQEANMPVSLRRKIYRLLSLYELADDEFSSVNKALKNNEDDLVYKLLRKIEGKFYKFAKFDFDRDTSLKDLKTILNYFDDERDKIKSLKISRVLLIITSPRLMKFLILTEGISMKFYY